MREGKGERRIPIKSTCTPFWVRSAILPEDSSLALSAAQPLLRMMGQKNYLKKIILKGYLHGFFPLDTLNAFIPGKIPKAMAEKNIATTM